MDYINLFHTPKSWDELIEWIDRHAKDDRAHLMTSAAMGWNLSVFINEQQQKEESDADTK